MIPRGAEQLIKLRQHGKRPVSRVWVNYGDDCVALEWWRWADTQAQPTLTIRTADPIYRLDLRCLVGLPVALSFPEWNARVSRLLDRIAEVAQEVAVISPSFGEDVGFWSIQGVGQFLIDEYPINSRRAA